MGFIGCVSVSLGVMLIAASTTFLQTGEFSQCNLEQLRPHCCSR